MRCRAARGCVSFFKQMQLRRRRCCGCHVKHNIFEGRLVEVIDVVDGSKGWAIKI